MKTQKVVCGTSSRVKVTTNLNKIYCEKIMDLYKLEKNQKLSDLAELKFDLERDIQVVIERNTQELFNLEFVKSEFTVNNYRMDTLCFDQEANSFVIIEYKNSQSYSVIDQGFTYLSTMLNNKSEFVLEYNETMGQSMKRNEVNWTQSRVIFVSPSFSQYQRDSVNFKDIPFELWEVKKFKGDMVAMNRVTTTSRQSMKGIEKTKDAVLNQVDVGDEETLLAKVPEEIRDRYGRLKDAISSWVDVSFKANNYYVAVLKGNKVRIYVNIQQKQIKIHMLRRIDFKGNVAAQPVKFELDDPKKLFQLVTSERKEIYTYLMKDDKNFDYVVLMLKQKFES